MLVYSFHMCMYFDIRNLGSFASLTVVSPYTLLLDPLCSDVHDLRMGIRDFQLEKVIHWTESNFSMRCEPHTTLLPETSA